MPTPRDKVLYDKIKNEITSAEGERCKRAYGKRKYRPSAYRSGLLTKKYKEAYEAKHKSKDAYIGKKNKNEGLSAWFKQEWRNQRGEIGYQKKGDIYRPTKISGKTPTLMQELTKKQIERAKREKAKTGRVKKFS